jgi:multicomponent K+:H+ antiporter subunit A
MAGGLALYFPLQRGGRLHAMTPGRWSGHRVYDDLLRLVIAFGDWLTTVTMSGGLRRQVAVLVVVSLAAGLAPFVIDGVPDRLLVLYTPMDAVAVTGWIVAGVATALAVAMHRQRFVAVILTGAVGLVVAGTFAHFSGPDLALTQIVVEVATTLLMLLALPHLAPVGALDSSTLRRIRDAALAVVGGIAMGGGAWWMMTRGGTTVSAEQAALSVPGGGGTNVVNVILVDFRGFDTYGEITVLAVAALGIVAMLSREPETAPRPADAPLMLTLLARILLPFGLLVAVHLFLRGHNLPGGGFVAGLVTAATLMLIPLVAGRAFAERVIRVDFHRVTAAGLAIAGATGFGAWVFGKPFLSSAHGHLDLPLLGDLHWASAALFDLGVFLVVVGVMMLVLQGLARVVPRDAATDSGSR